MQPTPWYILSLKNSHLRFSMKWLKNQITFLQIPDIISIKEVEVLIVVGGEKLPGHKGKSLPGWDTVAESSEESECRGHGAEGTSKARRVIQHGGVQHGGVQHSERAVLLPQICPEEWFY